MTAGPPARSRLAIGVIGPGRAGAALAGSLQQTGHRVLAVHARSDAARERAEALFPEADLLDPAGVAAASDLLLITVPDDDLPQVVAELAAEAPPHPGQLVVHASGRYGLGVLDPLTATGRIPLALHPAMTLTGSALDLQRLSGCPFAVTAPEAVLPIAEALVMEMGGEPLRVPDEARPMYHAALSHASNHLVTLLADALDLLGSAGIDQPDRLLAPLVQASVDNVLRTGDAALTGPVSRGDASTVAAHREALAASPVQAAYLAMARRTADRALASGRLTPEAGEQLLALLAGQPRG